MNALTGVKQPDDALSRTIAGFSIAPSVQSPRLLELTFCAEVTQQFLREVELWPVQALEFKSFLRFKIARIPDDMCGQYYTRFVVKNVDNLDRYLRQGKAGWMDCRERENIVRSSLTAEMKNAAACKAQSNEKG